MLTGVFDFAEDRIGEAREACKVRGFFRREGRKDESEFLLASFEDSEAIRVEATG